MYMNLNNVYETVKSLFKPLFFSNNINLCQIRYIVFKIKITNKYKV